jgi:hypothetical protein
MNASIRSAAALAMLLLASAPSLIPGEARGSVFALEGYGLWWDETDPAALGRGGTSIAHAGHGTIGMNPASIATTETSFGFGAYAGEITTGEGAAGSFRQRSDLLPQFGGVIVLPKGLRIGAMIRTQSDASSERESRVAGIEPFTARVLGSGGWSRIQLELAGAAFDRRLSWGAGIGRIQGTIKEDWRYSFDDADAIDSRQILEGRMRGAWVGTLGAIAQPLPALSIGATASLAGSSRLVSDSRMLEGGDFSSSRAGRQEIPEQWGVGVRLRPSRIVALSADAMQTLWNDAGLRAGPGEPESHPYHDTIRFGVGLELEPGPEGTAPRVYRVGFASKESYVQTRDGDQVTERAVTLGLRQRLARGRAALDASVEIGSRGDRGKTGVEERFVRLGVGVAFSSVIREY